MARRGKRIAFPITRIFREQAKSFAALCAYTEASTVLNDGGEARELRGVAATSGFFAVLRIAPILGRAYTRAEDSPDARVVVFTYEAWQRYFNGDPNIIGRQVRLALNPYTVIGIMPRGFRFPIDARSEYLMPVLPFSDNDSANSFWIAGRPDPGPGNHPDASNIIILGNYFQAMRIPLRAGRFFSDRDSKDSVPVVIVNEALAQKFFPNANPLGQHLLIDQEKGSAVCRDCWRGRQLAA